MEDTMRTEYFCPFMANDVHTTVGNCGRYAWNKPPEKCRRALQLFVTNRQLEFDTIDIVRPLSMMANGRQAVGKMKYGHLEVSKAV